MKSPTDSLTHPNATSSAFSEVSIFWWICFWVFIEWLNCKRMGVLQCYWTIYVENTNWDQLWSHMVSVCLLKIRFLREYVQFLFWTGPRLAKHILFKMEYVQTIAKLHSIAAQYRVTQTSCFTDSHHLSWLVIEFRTLEFSSSLLCIGCFIRLKRRFLHSLSEHAFSLQLTRFLSLSTV